MRISQLVKIAHYDDASIWMVTAYIIGWSVWFSNVQSSAPGGWYTVQIVICGWLRGNFSGRIVIHIVSSSGWFNYVHCLVGIVSRT